MRKDLEIAVEGSKGTNLCIFHGRIQKISPRVALATF